MNPRLRVALSMLLLGAPGCFAGENERAFPGAEGWAAGTPGWRGGAIDRRIIQQTRDGSGRVIDSETQGGGYPVTKETRRPFNPDEWDLRTMERRDGGASK